MNSPTAVKMKLMERIMAKKLIEGKTRKSKGKKMSHTGGNSRPLNLTYNEVT